MSITLDRSMVQRCYEYAVDEIKALESKKEQALAMGNAAGYHLAKIIDGQIKKRQEELDSIKYALDNMT